MKNLLVIALLCSTFVIQAAPNMSIYEAINKAGYQRMLTQRVAKCYLSIAAGLDAERQKTHLRGSAKTFENNLNELQEYAPTEKIRDQFRYVEILWRNYKFVYTDDFTTENAEIILQFNNKILKACHEAVVMLENYAVENKSYGDQETTAGDQELARVINLSGRQRMLTQRMALYTIAKTYSIGDSEENLQLYSTATNEFIEGYKSLMACSKNTTQIDEEYNSIGLHWSNLEASYAEVINAPGLSIQLKDKLLEVIERTDLLLFRFDEIVFLYERQKD